MNVYEQMLLELRRYHTNADGDRLAGEMLVGGFNVVSDFLQQKVGIPWLWSSRLENFYRTTDSFVYELLVWHHKPSRIAWRECVAQTVARLLPDGGRVLCLGDGIGYDSLSIASHVPGVEVTSFEIPGASSAFAARLLEDAGLAGRVACVGDPNQLIAGQYDIVLSFHVLEHVPEPPAMIREISTYLKRGGRALIAEAFGVVEPSHPTHLAANLKYAGRTIALFEKQGMAFEEMLPNWICVFQKGAPRNLLRFPGIRAKYRVAGLVDLKRFKRDYPDGTTDLTKVIRIDTPMFISNAGV